MLEKLSSLYHNGYGIELEVYELTPKQYQLILESDDIQMVDDTEWGLQDIGEHHLASDICLYFNDLEVTLKNIDWGAEDDLISKEGGPIVKKVIEPITSLGKFYAIRAWENKGSYWDCSIKGQFDETKLHINQTCLQIGNEVNGIKIRLFDFEYVDEEMTSYYDSSEGKGLDSYLVDDQGNVTKI